MRVISKQAIHKIEPIKPPYKRSRSRSIGLCVCVFKYTRVIIYTLKNAGLLTQIRPNMDKPSHWVTFLNDIFNPKFEFVHI